MTTKAYDEILARKIREREEGNKGMQQNIAMGMPLKIPHPIEMPIERPTGGYVTKSGRHYKSKPGRKPKVK